MGRLREDLSNLAAAKEVAPMETDEAEAGRASPRTAALLDVLEALRELSATYFSSRLLHQSQVVKLMCELRFHEVGHPIP